MACSWWKKQKSNAKLKQANCQWVDTGSQMCSQTNRGQQHTGSRSTESGTRSIVRQARSATCGQRGTKGAGRE
ncbi:unnamed protein product [Staurois parvus]|uniref:Uncharacterized protein n=1 Tax=Staurois parvus TaxID=386267 RepID=A0ABN9B2H4_9NEOB|nr:unnamed protein product [Staurois parvus]